VSRSEAAGVCPSEEELATQLRPRLQNTHTSSEPLVIDVTIDAEATDFTATVRVSGRRHGERSLRAPGPACDALRAALFVTLLLLLDEVPQGTREPEPPSKPALQPRPPSPQAPAAARAREPQRPPPRREAQRSLRTSGWIGAGGALTHGLPADFSAALFGDFALRLDRVEVSLGAFWTPERRVQYGPGSVLLNVWGGRLRACYRVPLVEPRFLLGACALGAVAALQGEGRGFTVDASKRRPWWLAGGGPEFRWSFAPRLALGANVQTLVTLHREGFTVQGLDAEGYTTDRVLGWVGFDVSLQIW
jgi:hypothetical protein